MRTNTAEQLDWPAPSARAPAPDPEPDALASCLAGPNGQALVVELAHDVRSPLASILFVSEALQNGQAGPVTDSQRRQLGLIYSAALSLCATASDVVELARGGNRLTDRQAAPFSIAEMFASVRSMGLPLAEEKRLEVRLGRPVRARGDGHLRPASRRRVVNATHAAAKTPAAGSETMTRPT